MIYTENPLHVEIVPTLVPIANEVLDEVRIEVRAEEVVDPKREEEDEETEEIEQPDQGLKKQCVNILYWAYFVLLIIALLSFLGGFILLLIWLNEPNLFGTTPV
jgi:hypothetical protein